MHFIHNTQHNTTQHNTYEHIKFISTAPVDSNNDGGRDLISSFIQGVISGLWASPKLLEQKLIALKKVKRDGSVDARPIIVGEALLRAAQKVALALVRDKVPALLCPLQVGVGVPNGVEKMVLAISKAKYVESDDTHNAYNTVSRAAVMRELIQKLPELAMMFQLVYGGTSNNYFCGHNVECTGGVYQGDAMAPLYFALALQPFLIEINDVPHRDQ